jgi:Tol biopolymer transport system component
MPALLAVGLLMNGCERSTSVTEPDLGNVSFAKGKGNGGEIAFVSNRDGNAEFYVMNADGTSQTNLTENSAYDDMPSWGK